MATSDRPRARQSQLVTTYGVGSLFPAGDQSFIICGIDHWDESWAQAVEEPRLARSLDVHTFRSPPSGKRSGDVPVVRFPNFHYCPQCRRLAEFWKFDKQKMRCDDCVRDLAPSRFVACCENGHLEDFPYFQWVHRGAAGAGQNHGLSLRARGASSSLADIVVHCSCGVVPRSLDGSFARHAMSQIKRCGGSRPWLPGAANEPCDQPLRALQRGSSNVWFGAVASSISIPPWSSPNAQYVSKHWDFFEDLEDDEITFMVSKVVKKKPGLSVEGMSHIVRQRKGLVSATKPSEQELRDEEYRALIDGNEGSALDTFQCTRVSVAQELSGLVGQVSKATRLREVRALQGFSRVTPTASSGSRNLAALSESRMTWLPGTEVLGEGIFVRLHEGAVAAWESGALSALRGAQMRESIERRATESGADVMEAPSMRFVAVHALSHAVLQELSLAAGYPVGSMRERIYADEGQAGFLIYTASSDAAGSLGGLAALADEDEFSSTFRAALSRAQWCSNDPVCAESGPSGADGLNLAACHACLLLPETSCEHRNIFLDRLSLVGSQDLPGVGIGAVVLEHPTQ